MATSISISDVLAQAAFRLHLPNFAAGEFVSDTQALMLAKMAVSRLGAMLNRSFGDNYFARTATLSTQAGLDLVSLPDDFKDLLSLTWVSGNDAQTVTRAEITDYDPTARSWSTAYVPKYRIEGETLVLTPIPSAVYTLRCAYTTGLSITSTADTIQALPGCDEWLVLDICQIIRGREDKDVSTYVLAKREIQEDLKAQAIQRDRHGTTAVRDVRGELEQDDVFFWRERLRYY